MREWESAAESCGNSQHAMAIAEAESDLESAGKVTSAARAGAGK